MRYSLFLAIFLVSSRLLFAQTTVDTQDYTLVLPAKPQGVIVLFPGYGHTGHQTLQEFAIAEAATGSNLAVVAMHFNRHLWMTVDEKAQLAQVLSAAMTAHQLPQDRVVMGGFSSGGNVALLLSNYLAQNQMPLKPAGVFIVDSPVDLEALYANYQVAIERNHDPTLVGEATYISQLFDTQLSGPSAVSSYREASPFQSSTGYFDNMAALEHTPLRLYTEPDMDWWGEVKGVTNLENTNAWMLRSMVGLLREDHGWKMIEYIETTGRGYRADGSRHPHSWSIIEVDELLQWIQTL